jgi:hypothetical protein
MTLPEAVAAFEAQFQHVVSLIHDNDSFAPNKQKFNVFAPGMTKKRGVVAVRPYASADDAIAAWLEEATALRGDKTILYWRINPHITTVQGGLTCLCNMAFGVEGDPLKRAEPDASEATS